MTAPLDIQPHVPPCADFDTHVTRCYTDVFPTGITLAQTPSLPDFVWAAEMAWDDEQEADEAA